ATAGDYALLEVVDCGTGMDRWMLDHICTPFFTTKEIGKGTGLGLPMVMGFVRQSKGYMSIRSEPGKGTVVRIILPAITEKFQTAK
ncbi:MAG: PAS domain-containing sensor histidine kinase, partial [Planctomycetaceae bacterium]